MDKNDSTIQQQQPIFSTEDECLGGGSALNQSFEVIERESECSRESLSSDPEKYYDLNGEITELGQVS